MSTEKQLKSNCENLSQTINNLKKDFDVFMKYKVLETKYLTDESLNYLGTELLLAYGGPTVTLRTEKESISGSWGLDSYQTSYSNLELENYLEKKFYMKLTTKFFAGNG